MKGIVWANGRVGEEHRGLIEQFDTQHWSRVFEYPWAVLNGNFEPGHAVLDAAGGDAPFQGWLIKKGCLVTNMDINKQAPVAGVTHDLTDLRKIALPDNFFDRVACLSVLEHVIDPMKAVSELYRVLTPGGRMTVTFDVATHRQHNHTVDEMQAAEIAAFFGLELPPMTGHELYVTFQEVEPQAWEPNAVGLRVLCLYADK